MESSLKLKRLPGADEFVELTMKLGSWDRNGIPEHGCRIRSADLEQMIANGGGYEADHVIRGLMDWVDVTDDPLRALATLQQVLDRHFPADGRTSATCHFADEESIDRRFIAGPVDLTGDVITWQRDNFIVAFAQASTAEPGRIVVAAPRPLSLKTAYRVLAISSVTDMLAPFDSFAGAERMASSTGNFYAWHQGELATCHWPEGLGKRLENGTVVDCSHELHPCDASSCLPPVQLAMQIGIAAGYLKW